MSSTNVVYAKAFGAGPPPAAPESSLARVSLALGASQHGVDEFVRPVDYSTIIEAWRLNSVHQRALLIKALASVGVGWRLYREDEPAPELEDAWRAAWPEGFEESMLALALDYEQFGNCYAEVVPGPDGMAAAYHVPAATIWRRPVGYRQRLDFVDLVLPEYAGVERGLWALRHYDPGASGYGLPDWISALNAIILDAYATEWNYRFFLNDAMPAWAITIENGVLDAGAEAAIKAMFDTEFKGLDKKHRILLLSASSGATVKFQQLQPRPQDMGFEGLKNICRDEVVAAHGVPPRLLGIVTPGQLGGGGEMTGQFKFFAECLVRTRQQTYSRWLTPLLPEGVTIRFTAMDVTSPIEDSQYYQQMVTSGILLPSEVRAELGLEPREELDAAVMARGLLP
jgi:phage portal protein BeeE